MIREIELIDFMSHRHTVIEPAAGLTVLVGPNNCGKSAIVVALQILAANSNKKHMIRHGCRECAVTVETNDGHTVTWRLKGKIVNYTIDGQDVHRLEGGLPDGLHEILKLAPVESVEGGESFDVHFARQKEPLFLLNGTGKQAAMFFASSSDASRLMAMQQRHKEKALEQRQLEKHLDAQAKSLKGQLELLTPLPSLQQAVDGATHEYQRLSAQINQMQELERCIQELAEHQLAVGHAQSRYEAMAPLQSPPALFNAQPLELLLQSMASSRAEIDAFGSRGDVLAGLSAPPALTDPTDLELICCEMGGQLTTEFNEDARSRALQKLASPPALTDAANLERLCEALSAEWNALSTGQAAVAALRSLLAPPELLATGILDTLTAAIEVATRDLAHRNAQVQLLILLPVPPLLVDETALTAATEQYTASQDLLAAHESDVAGLVPQLQETREEMVRWTDANPTCPTCGAAIDPDRVLLEAHHHG